MKIVIIDDDLEYCSQLKSELEDDQIRVVGTAHNGTEGLELIKRLQPDVAILDLIMPEMDGFSLIQRLPSDCRTRIIVLTALSKESFVMRALTLGASYYMVKPYDLAGLKNQILDNRPVRSNAPSNALANARKKSIEQKITDIFIMVGIPAHIKGYQFLREAILIAINEPEVINSITKRLYPAIAETFHTSPSKVERAIRHAIEVAWNRGKIENINSIFGVKVYSDSDRPTNGEFIALIADKMLLEGA